MLVRSWFVLFGLLALAAESLGSKRYTSNYYEKRADYTHKRRDFVDGNQNNNSADERSNSAANKVSESIFTQSLDAQNGGVQTQQDNSAGTLASFSELLQISRPRPEPPKTIKTYIVTKKVPVPYPVQYETRVPYPIKVPIRRPYAVYVPKPYYYEVPKPVPYTLKVPVPQPYHVEKHIPYPYKVPIDKPVPVHIAKPYPVFVEKKVPVPVEKEVPVQINIPVERPVEIPVEKPIPVPVEKPVLYPVKIPVDNQGISLDKPLNTIQGTTTYEVNIKDVPQLFNTQHLKFSSTENQDYTTPLKASTDFSPSPYDSFPSSLTDGKQQLISFVPEGNQNNAFQTLKHGYTFEPLSTINTQETSNWAPINSSDWIPRFITTYQTKVNQPETLKLVSSQNENEPKTTELETNNFQQELKLDEVPSFQQNQLYTFVPVNQKFSAQNPQETSGAFHVTQQNSQKLGQGNYQFYNVHPIQGSKTETAFSSISFQKFESEPKSSVEAPAQWVQVQRDATPQGSYQQQQHQLQQQLTQQNNKADTPQQLSSSLGQQADIQQQLSTSLGQQADTPRQLSTSLGQQAAKNLFISQDYEQFKQLQNSENREQQQVKHNIIASNGYSTNQFNNILQEERKQPSQNSQRGSTQPELNQFTNQNFPQLQQYQQQMNLQPQQYQQEINPQPQQYQQQMNPKPQQYQQNIQTELQTPNNYQNAQSFSGQRQYQEQTSPQTNHHQYQQLQQDHQQQQQPIQQEQAQNYQQTTPQHYQQTTPQQYQQTAPQQYHQQTQYHQQIVTPAQQFQSTFEQKQQLGDQDVKIFLGQGANGQRRRHRQPNSQHIAPSQQLLTVSTGPESTTESTIAAVSSSTEQPQRVRKSRRRNRKRNNNNKVESTTAYSTPN